MPCATLQHRCHLQTRSAHKSPIKLLLCPQAAFTSHVLAVDADFVPIAGGSVLLQKTAGGRGGGNSKVVYIVPIFTENGDHILPYPQSKADLLRSLKVEHIAP